MLDVRRLRLLRELARRGTIAAVAEALAFSPSAVSQQLGVLEREAGLPLLERTGRRVRLTPAGQNLVRHAEAVLERLEQADAELAEARSGLAGALRIGAFPTAIRAIVPAALVTLARRHPGLEPMVSETDPAAVAHALRAGDLDVALIHEYDFVPAQKEPGLAAEPLYREAMYLAAPTGTTGDAVTAERDLGQDAGERADRSPDRIPRQGPDQGSVLRAHADAPWITATPGTLCHAMALRACQAAGFTPRIRHQVDEFPTVLALVAAGQGVAVVPQLGVMGPADPAVSLTRLLMERRTKVAFRSGAAAHPAVAAFAAALRAAVPPELATPTSAA
ncbi:LysR substrate-binding domain-containing protein [Streptomyces sp. NBC_01443]|uniref:LysR substrate-binding domain-containing protein n=1 Tax=Streptomyces sp. NBC_01443 TaxID=2903868 RepID=UPI0022565A9B|nr:LysR substrate-binding domain-containing protein [Streptomyces sp. NBC_01443]MCX4626095.1 LysR substrate-binding domain-containing protein [Streptomyces sp. NBC_01443]